MLARRMLMVSGATGDKTAYNLDGTGDYLSVPNSADFDFGTNASFTIEAWVRLPTGGGSISDDLLGNGYLTGWLFNIQPGTLKFFAAGSQRISGSFTPSATTWTHLAVVRNSSTLELFVDGVSLGTASYGTAISSANELRVGADVDNTNDFLGQIDEIRVSTVARWTTNFTPPTRQYASDASTVLLIHCGETKTGTTGSGATFTDSGNTGHTVTENGNAIEDTTNYKF